jgi:hypothetical protein
MDGLDIYIDDYSKPSPLSKVEMAKMVGAQFLKLVDDPKAPKPPANASVQPAAQPLAAPAETETEASAQPPEAADASAIAASDTDPHTGPHTDTPDTPDTPDTDHDHHPDLQLQPDHAAQRPGPGHGAG